MIVDQITKSDEIRCKSAVCLSDTIKNDELRINKWMKSITCISVLRNKLGYNKEWKTLTKFHLKGVVCLYDAKS